MVIVRKMKEKCKDAARMRREKERTEFVELSKLLPLPASTTSQLDKASIIRLTSSYLRMRAAFPNGLGEHWGTGRPQQRSKCQLAPNGERSLTTPLQANASRPGQREPPPTRQLPQIRELGSLILQTLDGFVFALHKDGKIMYISETASVHLGLPQIDLTGSSAFEYIHPTDCNDLNELFKLSEADKSKLESMRQANPGDRFELGRSFCMRMKCILPKRNAGLVSNGYKAIHCSGYLKVRCNSPGANKDGLISANGGAGDDDADADAGQLANGNPRNPKPTKQQPATDNQLDGQTEAANKWEGYTLVAVGHSLLPTATTEVKLGANSFMFRASLDLKLYYLESPVIKLLGYDQTEMIGQSLYQFVHVEDCSHLAEAHRLLLNKGQVVTRYYRLMRRNGGFLWVETHATLVNNPRSMPKPQHIVSVCYIIGNEQSDESRLLSQRKSMPAGREPDFGSPNRPRRVAGMSSTNLDFACTMRPDNICLKRALSMNPEATKRCKTITSLVGQSQPTSRTSGGSANSTASNRRPSNRKLKHQQTDRIQAMANCSPVVGWRPMADVDLNEATANELVYRQEFSTNSELSAGSDIHQFGANPGLYEGQIVSPIYHTIGSTRRPSVDSCSVVSSVASTASISSSLVPSGHPHTRDSSFATSSQLVATSAYGHQQAFTRDEAVCTQEQSIEGLETTCLNSLSSLEGSASISCNSNQKNLQPIPTMSTAPSCEQVWLMPLSIANCGGSGGVGSCNGRETSSCNSGSSSRGSSSSNSSSSGSSSGSGCGGGGGGSSSCSINGNSSGGSRHMVSNTNEQSQQICHPSVKPMGPISNADNNYTDESGGAGNGGEPLAQLQTNSSWFSLQPLNKNSYTNQQTTDYSSSDMFYTTYQLIDTDEHHPTQTISSMSFGDQTNQNSFNSQHQEPHYVINSFQHNHLDKSQLDPIEAGNYSFELKTTELPIQQYYSQSNQCQHHHYQQSTNHYQHHTARLGDGYTL